MNPELECTEVLDNIENRVSCSCSCSCKNDDMTREDLMELNYIDVKEDDYIIVEI